jgi:hypothetical protein
MELSANNADAVAIKMIELLIQQGHYSGYGATAIEQIGKDTNALATALTGSAYMRKS